MPAEATKPIATLFRIESYQSICPHGLKAKRLLEARGFQVDDQKLTSRDEIDAFKQAHNVTTTPLIFIDDAPIGGFEALAEHFGETNSGAGEKTYQPVIALFAVAALLASAITVLVSDTIFTTQTAEFFIAIAMVLLALQKLQDIEKFATLFATYDLVAQRYHKYGYAYPIIELVGGLLMLTGAMVWLAAPIVLLVASVGAVSVFKAVYINKRVLSCACMGDSRVPLGFISLVENLMMAGMALWMIQQLFPN